MRALGGQGTHVAGPEIRQVTSALGSHIAWAVSGAGRPTVVVVGGWLSHLSLDWSAPDQGTFHQALSSRCRLIRYDRPGTGLSQRGVVEPTLDSQVDHLRRVIEAAAEDRVALFARTGGAAVALAFAAQQPASVSHVALFEGTPSLLRSASFPQGFDPATAAAVVSLIRAQWGLGARVVCEIVIPGASDSLAERFTSYLRAASDGATIATLIEAQIALDVTDLLASVSAPVLLMVRDQAPPCLAAGARRMAEGLPDVRLVVIDSLSDPFYGDTEMVVTTLTGFLAGSEPFSPGVDRSVALLSRREREVCALAAAGHRNSDIAGLLFISERTVEAHIATGLRKLGLTRRIQLVEALHQGRGSG